MKITKAELKDIIREEIKSSLNEASGPGSTLSDMKKMANKILSKKAVEGEIQAYADVIEHIIHALASGKAPKQPGSVAVGQSDSIYVLVEILVDVLRMNPHMSKVKQLVDLLGAYKTQNIKTILAAPPIDKVAQGALKDLGRTGNFADKLKERFGIADEKAVRN
jgi:hypothetical protein